MNRPIEELLDSATSDDEVVRIIYKQIAKRSAMRDVSSVGAHPGLMLISGSDHAFKLQGGKNEPKTSQPIEHNLASMITSNNTSELGTRMDEDDGWAPTVANGIDREYLQSKDYATAPTSTPRVEHVLGMNMHRATPAVKEKVAPHSEERQTLGIAPMGAYKSEEQIDFDDDAKMPAIPSIYPKFSNNENNDAMSDISNVSDHTEWCGVNVPDEESANVPWDEEEMDAVSTRCRKTLSGGVDYAGYVHEMEDWEFSTLIRQCHAENVRSVGLTRNLVHALLLEAAQEGWAQRYLSDIFPWYIIRHCNELDIDCSDLDENDMDGRIALIVQALRGRLQLNGYGSD